MTMLAERVDAVIGVDTHTDTHTCVICDARGAVLAHTTVATTEDGYNQLQDTLLRHAPGPRLAWAVEGTGSYGAGLHRALHRDDQEVIEVRTATRPHGQGKNDITDATAIARTALTLTVHTEPRHGQVREALRLLNLTRDADVKTRTRLINRFKAIVLTAPPLRDRLRGHSTTEQVRTALRLRGPKDADLTTRTCLRVLRDTASQISTLDTTIHATENELDSLTTTHAPTLRAELGIGPVTATQILLAWSHPGRFHSEAAFAALAGTSPLEASSGRTTRHRLNRTGDRHLNAALHRVILTRRRQQHPATHAYITRRTHEGRTHREIERCLKRYLARHLHRLLTTMPPMP